MKKKKCNQLEGNRAKLVVALTFKKDVMKASQAMQANIVNGKG